LLEAGCYVHDVASDHELVASRSRDNVPCVHADAHRKPNPMPLGEIRVHLGQAGLHVETRPESAFRVVLVHRRGSEDGHDRVADELLDGPSPRLDHRSHGFEVIAQERAQLFRVELLAQCRRAGQVGEQDRNQLPLFLLGRREIEAMTAGRAELSTDLRFLSARWAGADQDGATGRAEPSSRIDLRSARWAFEGPRHGHPPGPILTVPELPRKSELTGTVCSSGHGVKRSAFAETRPPKPMWDRGAGPSQMLSCR
jgi:hypothetical protein